MKNIYYLGPSGSYSYSVAKELYPKGNLIPCESFFSIINEVANDENVFGILPIENSSTSDVFENVDYLFSKNLNIVRESYLKINLNLIGLKESNLDLIKEVYSHPKALIQCARFIKKHNLIVHESLSTAAAQQIIIEKNNPKIAFIGSQDLARNSKLKVISADIGDAKNNVTRFIVVKKRVNDKDEIFKKESGKLIIIFKLLHQPGSLANLLNKLAEFKINLTKIESRPIPEEDWEYQFMVDLQIIPGQVKKIKEIFSKNTLDYNIIGIYEL